ARDAEPGRVPGGGYSKLLAVSSLLGSTPPGSIADPRTRPEKQSPQDLEILGADWLRGSDLNRRPLGYEGKNNEDHRLVSPSNPNALRGLTLPALAPIVPSRRGLPHSSRTPNAENPEARTDRESHEHSLELSLPWRQVRQHRRHSHIGSATRAIALTEPAFG